MWAPPALNPLDWRDPSDIESLGKYSPDDDALIKAMRSRHVLAVEEALRQPGLNVNSADKWGLTPLMLALKAEDWVLVPLLLDTPGVDVNARSKKGFTPLMFAAWKHMGRETPERLLKLGADPKASIDGRTAWDVAWDNHNQEALDVFKEHGMMPRGFDKRFVDPPPKEPAAKAEPTPVAAADAAAPGLDPQQAKAGLQALLQLLHVQKAQAQQGQP